MKPPHLNDSEDVLLSILTYLDVASVVQCQRVSRHFQALARSKQIWMFLVRDLDRRGLIDLPPPDVLSTYSAMQLVAEVKRIVVGPTTWLSHSDRQPTVRRQLHIPLGNYSLSPMLLPGGRHLLVERGLACELWDIAKSRRIWMRNGVSHGQVAVEYTCGKEELTFAIAMPMTIEIVRLNLHSNMQHVVASYKLPSRFLQVSNTVIKGDFIALAIDYQWILLLNWKETKVAILGLWGNFANHSLHLISGHLVALTSTASAEVFLYPIAAFESHWHPMTSKSLDAAARSSVNGGPFQPTVLRLAEYPRMEGRRPEQLFVHECPLRHSSFVVSTHSVCATTSGPYLHPSFHRFRLTISELTTPSRLHWRLLFSSDSVSAYEDFTYAGHGLSIISDVCMTQVVHRASTDGGVVPIPPQQRDTVSLSPYSGALCVCSHSGVDILYYE
ncbi:hypothetical protein GGX14DRAFT_677429 [Mycena pura]|uniref:F-box domain-containing protein n=1 Tax=Mycena pura TaxID=153505 RepID=A0AAD6UUN5_9AGAR|nr:hypothetical protein GGX14DRAFT_677429 [Mycena pura]